MKVIKAVLVGAVLATCGPSVAFGQSSVHYKTWPEALRFDGATPPGWKTSEIAPATVITPPNPLKQPIVIRFGPGGRVLEHKQQFSAYQRYKAKVEIRGPCYSACTIVLAYVEPENLCIAERAFMAFHAIRSIEHGEMMVGATQEYYASMPAPIQRWIRNSGGWQNLPLNGYWTLHDRQLWEMGYPKCQ